MQEEFNIFDILSKDNKELSHSSMIKFLLQESPFFANGLIQMNESELDIHLEFRLDKERADIVIFVKNKVIIIENKFKCLPHIDQLESYSKKLEKKFQGKKILKFLLYFEKGSDFIIPSGWEKITYADVLELINEYLKINDNLNPEKKTLLKHYGSSLKKYIDKYDDLKNVDSNSLREIFLNPERGNNKFWLHLIFHELAYHFDYYTWVGSGITYEPLINFHYPKWKFDNYEFVIQLNGRNLKYYAHLREVKNKEEVINEEVSRLEKFGFIKSESGKFKRKIASKSTTAYIYQEDIIDVIEAQNKKATLNNIKEAIENLIIKIENCRS